MLEAFSIATYVKTVLVNVIGEVFGVGSVRQVVRIPEKDLVAGVSDTSAVDFRTDECREAGVTGHWM